MPKLYISEYDALGREEHNTPAQVVEEPSLLDQAPVTFSTEAKSSAFGATTRFVRIWADANCCIKFGTNPVATTSNKPIAAQQPEYFGVRPGDKVSVIAL